ncbi:MAG: hypothetical protein WCS01_05110 [bacterium]
MPRVGCKQCGKVLRAGLAKCSRCGTAVTNQTRGGRRASLVIGCSAAAIIFGVAAAAVYISHVHPKTASASQQAVSAAPIVRSPSCMRTAIPKADHAKQRTLEDVFSLAVAPVATTNEWDVAEADLLCAQGLPGAEGATVAECLRTLDDWTEHVRKEIIRTYPKFLRHPALADNSEARYCVMMITTVLAEDMGCGYNMDLVNSGVMNDLTTRTFFRNSADLFIHGLLTGKKKGTCSSMPVFVTAIGRRLGFPLKLVGAKAHLFVRWEDAKERFNIECAGQGVAFYPDEYYMAWPQPISEDEIKQGLYLRSLTTAEELGTFLSLRASCLMANARYDDARSPAEKALVLYPADRTARQILMELAGMHQRQAVADRQRAMEDAAATMRANKQHEAANLVLGYEPAPGPAGSFRKGGR